MFSFNFLEKGLVKVSPPYLRMIFQKNCFSCYALPVDTGRKLNVQKTFRRRPGRLLNVFCTFSLRPVSTWLLHDQMSLTDCLYFLRYCSICVLQLFVDQAVTPFILKLTLSF